jgi:hypothetical protein
MLAVPALTPVTKPEPETVATAALLLLQVPPVVALLNVDPWPTQTSASPVLAASPAFTVTSAVAEQLPSVYTILVEPVLIAVTTPVEASTDAIEPSPLLHAPPVVDELSVVVLPLQSVSDPVIAPGVASVVNTDVVTHPALVV